jgi:PKD repeat protein
LKNYPVNLIAIGEGECRDTAIQYITTRPYINAAFECDTALCQFGELIIYDQSEGADSYLWDFGDGTPVSTSPGPEIKHIYLNSGSDTVTRTLQLNIENKDGCISQVTRDIVIYPESLGGELSGEPGPITYGESTGEITLSGYRGKITKWQRIVKAGPWEDLLTTEVNYHDVPDSEGLWQYRAVVQNGACAAVFSGSFSILVLPKEILITPAPDQVKDAGEPDPSFIFTNSEWSDNTNFEGALGRVPGEGAGAYPFTLGNLSAGPNYTLVLDTSSPGFTINSTVGLDNLLSDERMTLTSSMNPFHHSTVLTYTIPENGRVMLTIWDLSGRVVRTLIGGSMHTRGPYSLQIGEADLDPGVYIVTLTLDTDSELRLKTLKLVKGR